jgi:GTPases - translation elongation factors
MSFSFTDEDGRDPAHDSAKMVITDIFETEQFGLIIAGQLEYGVLRKGDEVLLVKEDGSSIKSTVQRVEALRQEVNSAEPGKYVGLILGGITRDRVKSGDSIVKV